MTTTSNKQLNLPTYNQTSPTWDIPLNANFNYIDSAFGSTASVALTNSPVTLTSTQCQNMRINFTGAISSNITVTWPSEGGFWIVSNFTTGTYILTAASAGGGNAVTINQGFSVTIYSDGTNIYFANDGLTSSAGAANGVFYLNNQEVTANYIIPSNQNAMTAGPIVIDAGITITIQSPSTWTII